MAHSNKPDRNPAKTQLRRRSERHGRLAEWLAAAVLLVRGYRILSRRVRTPFGEIDLIARRGSRIAFVEVKYRKDFSSNSMPITRKQADRIAKAAEYWLWRQKAYRAHTIGLDCILISQTGVPQHIPDALQPST